MTRIPLVKENALILPVVVGSALPSPTIFLEQTNLHKIKSSGKLEPRKHARHSFTGAL